MNTNEFRVLAKHCFLIGRDIDEAKEWLDKKYEGSAPDKSTIEGWYTEFRSAGLTPSNESSKRPNKTQPRKRKQ